MLYGNFPFRAENVDELEELVLAGKYSLGDTVSVEARRLIKQILSQEPSERPSIEEILNDPWMQSIDESVLLFTDEEIQAIKREYSFKDRLEENSNTSVFTEHDLDATENSSEGIGADISKSVILAPFNSLVQNEDELIEMTKNLIVDKKIIKYRSKLREFNRKYERDNNSKLDNGVYVQAAGNLANKVNQPKSEKTLIKTDKEEKSKQQGSGKTTKGIITNQHPTMGSYIDRNILKKMEQMGFDKPFVMASLSNNDLNCATTTYYLMSEKDNLN